MDTTDGGNMAQEKIPNYEIGRKKLKALIQNQLHWNFLSFSDYQIYIQDSDNTVQSQLEEK